MVHARPPEAAGFRARGRDWLRSPSRSGYRYGPDNGRGVQCRCAAAVRLPTDGKTRDAFYAYKIADRDIDKFIADPGNAARKDQPALIEIRSRAAGIGGSSRPLGAARDGWWTNPCRTHTRDNDAFDSTTAAVGRGDHDWENRWARSGECFVRDQRIPGGSHSRLLAQPRGGAGQAASRKPDQHGRA